MLIVHDPYPVLCTQRMDHLLERVSETGQIVIAPYLSHSTMQDCPLDSTAMCPHVLGYSRTVRGRRRKSVSMRVGTVLGQLSG